MPLDASFYTAVYPWDMPADDSVRAPQLVNPMLLDPRAGLNQTAIIETYAFEGVEAWDFANPYAIASAQLLDKPTLVPDYGLRGSTPQAVAANIASMPVLIPGV